MKIEHLRLFAFIANSPSINSAAKELFISQQQLNRIVTGLEDELHTKLFVRSNKGISLTPNGNVFLEYVNRILCDYDEMQNYFYANQSFSVLYNQSIQDNCILYVPMFFSVYLNDFIFKFKEVAPGVHLTCIEEHESIPEGLNKKNFQEGLHLLIYISSDNALKQAQTDLIVEKVGSYSLFLIVNKNSDLSKMVSVDTATMNLPQFLTLTPSMDVSFGINNERLFVSSNIFQHIEAVIKHNSVFPAPDFVLPKLRPYVSDICFIPINKNTHYHQYITYSKSHTLTAAESLLISFIKLYMQNLSLIARHMVTPSIDEL